MTLDSIAHLLLATANGTMAWILWHSAVPRVKHARGDWHGACMLLLGFILAVISSYLLQMAWEGRQLEWERATIASLLLVYAGCRLRYALRLSDCTWSGCPT